MLSEAIALAFLSFYFILDFSNAFLVSSWKIMALFSTFSLSLSLFLLDVYFIVLLMGFFKE